MEGAESTEPDVPYLSRYPDNYFNVSIHPVLCPCVIDRYLSDCNTIDNHNRICQSDLALEKYWVTHSGYFRLATTVELGMRIPDGKLLFCHEILEQNIDKIVTRIDYNYWTVYD